MKKTIIIAFVLLIFPVSAFAYTVRSDESMYLPTDRTVAGTYYAVGSSITLEGNVDGYLFCAGSSIRVNGNVTGDIICFGETITINGNVGGNVRVVGDQININGQVNKNVTAAGITFFTSRDSVVSGEMLVLAGTAEILGTINKELYGAGSKITIGGTVNGEVKFWLEGRDYNIIKKSGESSLVIMEDAQINGGLYYSDNAQVEIHDHATIVGPTEAFAGHQYEKRINLLSGSYRLVASMFSAMILGMVLITLFGKRIKEANKKMLALVGGSLGLGLLTLFATPLACILLLFTVIGIPLAAIVIMLWVITLLVGKVVTAMLIGEKLITKYKPSKKNSLPWAMATGIISLWLLFSLPFFGGALSFVALVWGLGGIAYTFKKA